MNHRFLLAICAINSFWIVGCSADETENTFPPIQELDINVDLGFDQTPDLEPDQGPTLPDVTHETVLDYVDPFIGTSGLGFSYGGLTPAAQAPLGMIRVGPDSSFGGDYGTTINRFSGYEGNDPNVRGFSHLHFVGTGVADFGNLRFLPTTREVIERPYGEWYATFESQDARPGTYHAELAEGKVAVQIAAGIRAAIHRYKFQDPAQGNVVSLDPSSSLKNSGILDATWNFDGTEWTAEFTYKGSYAGRQRPFTLFASVVPNHTPSNVQTWNAETESWEDGTQGSGTRTAALLTFEEDLVELRVGISFQSLEQARANREAEANDFDTLQQSTENAWKDHLARILVQGGTEDERTLFYTALYNVFRMPTRLDESGKYTGLDGLIHDLRPGHDRYFTDLSLWDTYRTLHPLWTLIAPDAQRDALNSLLRMGEDGGYIPRWPAALSYTSGMEGEPAAIMFAESAQKQIDGVDYEAAFQSFKVVADASPPPGTPYQARGGIERYIELGYIPADEQSSSASNTLEWALADHALGRLAQTLGHTEDAPRYLARGESWKNIYNPDEGFFWPRNADGSWANLPSRTAYNERSGIFVEGSAWHYRFYVLHDPKALAQFVGEEALEERLDEFFEKSKLFNGNRTQLFLPDPYYWHGNQPSIHTVTFYAALGRLDKLSHWTRQIQYFAYTTGKDGLPGNDDGGTMSAWLVLSAMGLYPLVGTDTYVPMPPMFPRLTVQLEDSQLVVEAPGASREKGLISEVLLNNEVVAETIKHNALNGSTLRYSLDLFQR